MTTDMLPMSEEGAVVPGLIKHLSASSIETYRDCPRKFYLRYVLKIPSQGDVGLVSGRAMHYGAEVALRAKMDGDDPTWEYVYDRVRKSAVEELDREEILDDSRGHAIDRSVRLTKAWFDEVFEQIEPMRVEEWLDVLIEGIKVVGRLDCQTKDGRVHDWKTKNKTPSESDAYKKVQAEIYTFASGGAPVTFHYMVDLKKGVTVHQQSVETPQEIDLFMEFAQDTVYHTAKAIRAGAFPRNRNSYLCSEKWCPFYEGCVVNPVKEWDPS
jgi:hypothetical protein